MNGSVAVVGDRGSVLGFRALGLEVCPAATAEAAREIIYKLGKTDCAVIYLTETLAKDLPDVLARYKDAMRLAIILIPGREGSLGIGRANLQSTVERAVGVDIL